MSVPEESKEKIDEYVVTIVEGSSAFTKRPSTAFRMAGVGMLSDPYCFTRIETPPAPSIYNPSDVSIIGDVPVPKCEVSLKSSVVSANLGTVATFRFTHVNTSGVLKIDTIFDETALEESGENQFKVLKLGIHELTFVVTYMDGQECKIEATVIGEFKCDFKVGVEPASVSTGQTVTYTTDHGVNKSSLVKLDVELPAGVEKVGENGFTSNTPGAYAITFTADYGDGHLCNVTVNAEFKEKPCDIILTPATIAKNVGDTFTIGVNPGVNNTSGILKTDVVYDTAAFSEANPGYKALKVGSYDFEYTVTYQDGKVCKAKVKVTIGETPCDLKAIPSKYTMAIGESFTIRYEHSNPLPRTSLIVSAPSVSFTRDSEEKSYTANAAGAFAFHVTATYEDGQVCKATFNVTVEEPAPPDPTKPKCGEVAKDESGTATFTYDGVAIESGLYYIDYNFLAQPDTMEIFVSGSRIFTTGHVNEGSSNSATGNPGSPFAFNYKPADGPLKVVMNGAVPGSAWQFTLYCPTSTPDHIIANSKGTIN